MGLYMYTILRRTYRASIHVFECGYCVYARLFRYNNANVVVRLCFDTIGWFGIHITCAENQWHAASIYSDGIDLRVYVCVCHSNIQSCECFKFWAISQNG